MSNYLTISALQNCFWGETPSAFKDFTAFIACAVIAGTIYATIFYFD